jgi:hypothetical protein
MKYLNLNNTSYIHIELLQRIRNCQISDFFTKMVFGAFILLSLQACASPAFYKANLKYEPTGTFRQLAKAGPDTLITVAMFNDIRQTDDKLKLGRVKTIGGTVVPILPGDMKVPDAVTLSIREYLYLSGYKVSTDVPIWDLKEKSINKGWGKILIGGNIDALEIVCDDSFPVKTYQTNLMLTFVFADVAKKKIFYRSTIDTGASWEDVSFAEEILEKQINAAFSDALEKMLNDPSMRNELRMRQR